MDNKRPMNRQKIPPISNILLQNYALSTYNFRISETASLRYSRGHSAFLLVALHSLSMLNSALASCRRLFAFAHQATQVGNSQINLTLVQFAYARGCRDSACRVRLCFCYRTRHAVSLPCFCSLLPANFGFRSLIRISETAFLKYSRSKKLKQVWFFTHLFVPLP